ncbi:MAG: biotin--[acetyl-CoA-carboxylase] ligase [Verrucomicrobiae bacterium]|nr:biotin--[acetyl-CoA-carboxylase] ligase [Verrucomicrobiae bacterium]
MTGGALDPLAIRMALANLVGSRVAGRFDPKVVAETRSTNDDAIQLGLEGATEGTVVFAEHQTSGRGRRGDAWVSPPGTNLLLTLLLRPETPVTTWTRIPHLAGLAVCRALKSAFPSLPPAKLKWPNDVYLDDRKLAGILVESRSLGGRPPFAVLGIGLNVNGPREAFPPELRPIATSLLEHTGHVIDRNALAAALLAEWAVLYPTELSGDFSGCREELRDVSWLWGRSLTIHSGGREIIGTAADIGPEGELIIERPDGSREPVVSADRVVW